MYDFILVRRFVIRRYVYEDFGLVILPSGVRHGGAELHLQVCSGPATLVAGK